MGRRRRCEQLSLFVCLLPNRHVYAWGPRPAPPQPGRRTRAQHPPWAEGQALCTVSPVSGVGLPNQNVGIAHPALQDHDTTSTSLARPVQSEVANTYMRTSQQALNTHTREQRGFTTPQAARPQGAPTVCRPTCTTTAVPTKLPKLLSEICLHAARPGAQQASQVRI